MKNLRTVKSYASKVLDFAIKRNYIQTNPSSHVDMPTLKKNSLEELEDEQENHYKAYTLFCLLTFSGMRQGEALALTWHDVNFIKSEIRINKAISRGKDNKLYVKTTKTGTTRTIKMDEKSMLVLKEWKKKQRKDYFILGFNTLQKN